MKSLRTEITRDTATIGMKCLTPSGLGGSFSVKIIEIGETDALVKNSGNHDDWDEMPAYRVTFDKLRLR